MTVYEDQCQFGWEGDNGIGEQLIQQILRGEKTATCAPKLAYEANELAAVYAMVGKIATVTDKFGTPRCNIRYLDVFETTFGNPDSRLVRGEGDGDDVEKFKRDHLHAWNGMACEGHPLSNETVLVVELFELVEEI